MLLMGCLFSTNEIDQKMEGGEVNACSVCGNSCNTRCSRCKTARYWLCQITHWKAGHKYVCVERVNTTDQETRPAKPLNGDKTEEVDHEPTKDRVTYLQEELVKSKEEIELLQSECDNWKIRTEFVSKRLHRFIKKSDQDENVGGARIAERKEQDCIKMLKSELQMEREHVQRLKLELEEITHGATIRVEEARLAEMRKQEKCIRMLMSEMTKMRKNLKEERKRDKTNQIAIKKVEEITLDLANARNDLASAISRAEVAEAKLSDLEKKIRLTDDKYICAICLENEKDMAFSCGHMTCRDCVLKSRMSMCPICRKQITSSIRLFHG